jgi:hypothetical protein
MVWPVRIYASPMRVEHCRGNLSWRQPAKVPRFQPTGRELAMYPDVASRPRILAASVFDTQSAQNGCGGANTQPLRFVRGQACRCRQINFRRLEESQERSRGTNVPASAGMNGITAHLATSLRIFVRYVRCQLCRVIVSWPRWRSQLPPSYGHDGILIVVGAVAVTRDGRWPQNPNTIRD